MFGRKSTVHFKEERRLIAAFLLLTVVACGVSLTTGPTKDDSKTFIGMAPTERHHQPYVRLVRLTAIACGPHLFTRLPASVTTFGLAQKVAPEQVDLIN